ncbi:STAS domain-containing protein [Streptomyces albogriseolus]|uniref:STAS domain-containing protein n=1 Tax=Streptomyces albogriseolus TaxID=1887 RepID=UPI0033BBBE08
MRTKRGTPTGRPPCTWTSAGQAAAVTWSRSKGTLDLHTARRLADTLQSLLLVEGHSVLLDLSGVTFLDSSGLTCLIAAYRTAGTTGARLALIAPSQPVRRMLALTGVDQVLHSCPAPEAVSDWPTG